MVQQQRIESVDLFRVFAIVAVIAIHTGPFRATSDVEESVLQVGVLINQLARFAVPFFFVVSGYFWGLKVRTQASPWPVSWHMIKRIAAIFAFWSLIYVIPFDLGAMIRNGVLTEMKATYWGLSSILSDPVRMISQGTKGHLWFLPALISAIAIVTFMLQKNWHAGLIILSLALYVIGLLGKGYADAPMGIHIGVNTRNGPFVATALFASGYYISNYRPRPAWLILGAFIAGGGMMLHLAELAILHRLYGTPLNQDYLLGTYFAGMGVAIMALSGNRYLQAAFVAKLGKLILGIYACHYIFVELLNAGTHSQFGDSFVWQIAYVALVFIFSMSLVLVMSRFERLKQFVM